MCPMERRRLAWLVSFPLMAVSSLLAHSASYRLVVSEEGERARLLADSGHGYLAFGPLLLAASLTLVLLGLTALAFEGALGRSRPRSSSSWPFAVLPVLGFVVQEHLERLIHDGGFPFEAALEPTFLVGVLLQVAFAVAALMLARALAGAAHTLGRALVGEIRDARVAAPFALAPFGIALPPTALLALGHAERAPPLLLPR